MGDTLTFAIFAILKRRLRLLVINVITVIDYVTFQKLTRKAVLNVISIFTMKSKKLFPRMATELIPCVPKLIIFPCRVLYYYSFGLNLTSNSCLV
nr:hypothetical protein 1048p_00064 [Serratia proteamaculans]